MRRSCKEASIHFPCWFRTSRVLIALTGFTLQSKRRADGSRTLWAGAFGSIERGKELRVSPMSIACACTYATSDPSNAMVAVAGVGVDRRCCKQSTNASCAVNAARKVHACVEALLRAPRCKRGSAVGWATRRRYPVRSAEPSFCAERWGVLKLTCSAGRKAGWQSAVTNREQQHRLLSGCVRAILV